MDQVRTLPGRGPLILALLLGAVALAIRLWSPGIPEASDGIMHYQFARFAPQHPSLLLDLWAKPVFTIVAVPFAQMGAWGMALLNTLLFVLTCVPLMRMAEARLMGSAWAVPVALLPAPVYLEMVVGGMTEVLFGALTVWTLWFLWNDRYLAAALVASLMPLSRPEWVGVLPFVVLWMVWKGAWRQLPWLASTVVVVGALGVWVRRDPLWLLHDHPYLSDVSYYGSGSFLHYVIEAPRILGLPLLMAFVIALLFIAVELKRRQLQEHGLLFVVWLALFPVFAILFIHSWVWWKGSHGSYGLVRVLATVVPLVVLIAVQGIALLLRGKLPGVRWGSAVLLLGYGAWATVDLLARVPVPIPIAMTEQTVDEGGAFIRSLGASDRRITYARPYIPFALDRDPFDTTRTPSMWTLDRTREDLGLADGDLIFWDSQMSATQGGLPLERLLASAEFVLRGGWSGREADPYFEVFVFERRRTDHTIAADTVFDLALPRDRRSELARAFVACPDQPAAINCLATEFPFTIPDPVKPNGSAWHELVVEGTLRFPAAAHGPLRLVLVEKDHNGRTIRYEQSDVEAGPFAVRMRMQARTVGSSNSLYWWRPGGGPFALDAFRVLRLDHDRP
ncbi:MAG: hypothetical protein IPH53_13040 [Flavobacteriales bacterium]|jgi:hypothetical protein|nr:hypothetical protein [Flavobacteriales bacterium]MBK9073511.1 hypothetical protein [Flavobacteriales bacterium]